MNTKYHVLVIDFGPYDYATCAQRQFNCLAAARRYALKKARKFIRQSDSKTITHQNWGVTCGSPRDLKYRSAIITVRNNFVKMT